MAKVKANKQNKNKNNMKNKNKNNNMTKVRKQTKFSNVSTIDTAPVAIGNSIRGSRPVVTNSIDGCRVVGRDFCFEAKATIAAITGWSLIGGMPLTPSVLATSSLKSYSQLFSKFKINRIAFHYITSSPTTQAGDVMFYYEHDRNGPMIDFSNNSFLPFVLSDPGTILGPQWNNHTSVVTPVSDWNSTNYGVTTDLNEETDGSLFLFSKTNAANSPGYVLVDFDITFKEMCINPRAGILPMTRGLWNYLTVGVTSAVVTTGTAFQPLIQGLNPDGTNSVAPSGNIVGDIYKVIFLLTESQQANPAWVNVNATNLLTYNTVAGKVTVVVDDGFTAYGVVGATAVTLYANLEGAKTEAANYFTWGVAATVSANICLMVSCVASVNGNTQSSY